MYLVKVCKRSNPETSRGFFEWIDNLLILGAKEQFILTIVNVCMQMPRPRSITAIIVAVIVVSGLLVTLSLPATAHFGRLHIQTKVICSEVMMMDEYGNC